jgi:hypothetical protein
MLLFIRYWENGNLQDSIQYFYRENEKSAYAVGWRNILMNQAKLQKRLA